MTDPVQKTIQFGRAGAIWGRDLWEPARDEQQWDLVYRSELYINNMGQWSRLIAEINQAMTEVVLSVTNRAWQL